MDKFHDKLKLDLQSQPVNADNSFITVIKMKIRRYEKKRVIVLLLAVAISLALLGAISIVPDFLPFDWTD